MKPIQAHGGFLQMTSWWGETPDADHRLEPILLRFPKKAKLGLECRPTGERTEIPRGRKRIRVPFGPFVVKFLPEL